MRELRNDLAGLSNLDPTASVHSKMLSGDCGAEVTVMAGLQKLVCETRADEITGSRLECMRLLHYARGYRMAEGFALLIWLLLFILSIAMVIAQLKLFKISDTLQRILAIMEQQQAVREPAMRQPAVASTEQPPMVAREMFECTNCQYRVGVERGEPGRCGNCGNKKWERKMVMVPAPKTS